MEKIIKKNLKKMKRIDENRIEVTRVDDIYTKNKKTGNPVLIKRNVVSKLVIDENLIKITEQFIDTKGRIIKSRCIITSEIGKEILLKEKYQDMISLQKVKNTIGFKYKGRT